MSSKVEVKCKQCKKLFMARIADRQRGWGKFCSKSCKAKKQESRTHQCRDHYTNYLGSGVSREKFLYYQNNYGENPQFSNNGEFEGVSGNGFDNCEHQNSTRD